MHHTYGMRLGGFSPGCQPMKGFVRRTDDPSGRYYDLLIYDRPLTEKELADYELDAVATNDADALAQAREGRQI